MLKSAGKSFAGFAGKTGKLFGQGGRRGIAGYEVGGVETLDGRPFGVRMDAHYQTSPKASASEIFDIGALLRLRTFVYLLFATALFLAQINNTLAINDLAKRNERLREQLRISTSIRTAEELKLRELQNIRYISVHASKLGFDSSFIPPVEIEP